MSLVADGSVTGLNDDVYELRKKGGSRYVADWRAYVVAYVDSPLYG